MIALLLIVVMAWVIAGVVNLAARKPVVSAGRIGFILIALFVGVGVVPTRIGCGEFGPGVSNCGGEVRTGRAR